MQMIVDGERIKFTEGDSVLIALLRAGLYPTKGGTLCCGGDCPHCVATVNGVSYVRTCQTKAKPGMIVARHPSDGDPPLPTDNQHGAEITAQNLHCDVVVIGAGESGQQAAAKATAAGKQVIVLDGELGQDAVGIYAGPLVVARTDAGMWHVHARDEVIVATGSAEIQPVAPNNQLKGLLTSRATVQLAAAGLDLGHIVAIGTPPAGVDCEKVLGQIVRFEGTERVEAVIVSDPAGTQRRYACDTVSLGLGKHPRDALRRQGHDLPVRAVGDAALESDIPPCPVAGVVCPCTGVTVADLDFTYASGFQELELVKRSTLCGTGTCQGSVCMPHLRSFLADRGNELPKPFTARPLTRQVTIEEIAAGAHHHADARTALDAEHRRLGAQMERSGGWWRPWHYGDTLAEYWAVREAVSIMDVSTLGKMIVSGPDALAFLQKIYPSDIATIRTGRARYVLLLDERGYVFDDGLVAKQSDTRYALTFTSGGTTHAEMWLRDWASSGDFDVRIMNQTHTLGTINVTGPLADKLLTRAGLAQKPRFMRHKAAVVAGVACQVYRLSFTGEVSYELHHSAENSPKLWRKLLELGQDLGIRPHGLEALLLLRLEKGHIIVGQDSDFDTTPRRIQHEWMVNLAKGGDFIGRTSLIRTNRIPLDKQLVSFEIEGAAPHEGAVIYHEGEYAGYLTSCATSPVLGKSVALGWLYLFAGKLPSHVTVGKQIARRVDLPFYDKEATRARA